MSRLDSRKHGGRPRRETDRELLQAVSELNDGKIPDATMSNIGEKTGYSRSQIRRRLLSLKDEGYLESKKQDQSLLWWLTDEGENEVETA
jgi:DNA-binding IclR family transcriptional regulator